MSLSELLVAACITILVAGAALAAITPLQRGFAAQPEAAGLSQRTRVVTELLTADLRRASLVLPLRFGAVDNDIARGVFHRDDVVTTFTDPVAALASGAVTPSASRTYHLKQDADGIWQLMQYDGLASDQPAVEDVDRLEVRILRRLVSRQLRQSRSEATCGRPTVRRRRFRPSTILAIRGEQERTARSPMPEVNTCRACPSLGRRSRADRPGSASGRPLVSGRRARLQVRRRSAAHPACPGARAASGGTTVSRPCRERGSRTGEPPAIRGGMFPTNA